MVSPGNQPESKSSRRNDPDQNRTNDLVAVFPIGRTIPSAVSLCNGQEKTDVVQCYPGACKIRGFRSDTKYQNHFSLVPPFPGKDNRITL